MRRESVKLRELELGDVILYKGENGKESRGIIYSNDYDRETGRFDGFKVIPVRLQSKAIAKPAPVDGTETEKIRSAELLESLGGDRDKDFAYAFYKMDIAKVGRNSTSGKVGQFERVGSMAATKLLAEMQATVIDLVNQGKLQLDEMPEDPRATLDRMHDNRRSRGATYQSMGDQDAGGKPFSDKLTKPARETRTPFGERNVRRQQPRDFGRTRQKSIDAEFNKVTLAQCEDDGAMNPATVQIFQRAFDMKDASEIKLHEAYEKVNDKTKWAGFIESVSDPRITAPAAKQEQFERIRSSMVEVIRAHQQYRK